MLRKVRRIAGLAIDNEVSMKMKRTINRKKFFGNIGKGFLLIAVVKYFPFKFIKNINRNSAKVKVTIHPSAIKRNK